MHFPRSEANNGVVNRNNNWGVAIGWAETSVDDPACPPPQKLQFKPVAWDFGQPIELPIKNGDRGWGCNNTPSCASKKLNTKRLKISGRWKYTECPVSGTDSSLAPGTRFASATAAGGGKITSSLPEINSTGTESCFKSEAGRVHAARNFVRSASLLRFALRRSWTFLRVVARRCGRLRCLSC